MSTDVQTTDQFEKAYGALNKRQKQAVDAIEGPVLVVAGPGSGKTQILSLRAGNILQQSDVLPNNILCLTFTESAAANMRDRLAGLIGRDAYRVAIHTFHSFGVEIIQKYPEYFFGGATFSPADTLVQIDVLEAIFQGMAHDNPLATTHPEQGYVYLRPALSAISDLKKAGIRPEEFRDALAHNRGALEVINPLLGEVLGKRVSKKQFAEVERVAKRLQEYARAEEAYPIPHYRSLSTVVAQTLTAALEDAEEQEKTEPLSKWKQKWLRKDDRDEHVLKDTLQMEKLFALADVYRMYMDNLHHAGYYDFDDMLLDAINAVEANDALRYDLQERYQYVMIDEFQDTNDAQLRLIRLITDAPVNENRPNIMAVGDDDQAVYKFQGAEISNILDFRDSFRDPEVVVMTDNYRSRQDILDLARYVITKGEDRLENRLDELSKELTASSDQLSDGDIFNKNFPTAAHEYHWIASEIRRAIEAGKDPEDIAVISRKHHQLEGLVPYLAAEGVPIYYERRQNVFDEPHIAQLITMSRFIDSLACANTDEADEYLPEILAYPFWGLKRRIVWEISITASREYKTWLEVMCDHADGRVQDIASFLIECAGEAKYLPLEQMLDRMIGAHVPLRTEADDEGEHDQKSGPVYSADGMIESPFKQFYFSQEQFEHERSTYLAFLSSLQAFARALREYKHGEPLKLTDLVTFVDLHKKNGLTVNDQSPFTNSDTAVQLLTAHKAKGLEFDTVFVVSCQQNVWRGSGGVNKIPNPTNLPISAAGETMDDQLRLFFVALTRARHTLYLTSYDRDEKGKETSRLEFLLPDTGEDAPTVLSALERNIQNDDVPDTHNVLTASWLRYHTPEFRDEETALLKTLLKEYQMSVTHLNNFLNVARGGPQLFLEQNLLQFPKAKTAVAAYGTATHRAIELAYQYLKKNESLPDTKEVVAWFERELYKQRLPDEEYERYRARGADAIAVFYNLKKDRFDAQDELEVSFKRQGVIVDGVPITGKIDKMSVINAPQVNVYDFKTGKPYARWTGGSPDEQIKLREYQRQLIFYKLLVEESRDYGAYRVETGTLEFINPEQKKTLDLSLHITDDMVAHQRALIKAVADKISAFDFPDISSYEKTRQGVEQFEQDLIEGTA